MATYFTKKMKSGSIDGQRTKSVIILGVCAMKKKANSPTMLGILKRVLECRYIKVNIFEEDVILNKPIEEWPNCDVFLAFFSSGFPLDKALKYSDIYRPTVLNDLRMQFVLQDRLKVYNILKENGIPIPNYHVKCEDVNEEEIIENDDYIEIRGVKITKPFVEKPFNAEDHNIYIYYSRSQGGGSQRLFRKVGDESSSFTTESKIRKLGSYIYEEFLCTNGIDIKVYAVGSDYAHSEARKSPGYDEKVERSDTGNEVRYPVMLAPIEKAISKKIYNCFKQIVCGFDLLRTNDKSYVCDVNGFSMVKNSPKYIEDCSDIIVSTILNEQSKYMNESIMGNLVSSNILSPLNISRRFSEQIDEEKPSDELICVIAVIKHGERKPKQKIKITIDHPKLSELFHKFNRRNSDKIKLKKPKQIEEILIITKEILDKMKEHTESDMSKLNFHNLKSLREVLEYCENAKVYKKVQIKRTNSNDQLQQDISEPLLVILKWEGDLTNAGKKKAEDFGKAFRATYCLENAVEANPGCYHLRLHSTFNHHIKIYSSDEGRVESTASAFSKGFLELEGSTKNYFGPIIKRDYNSFILLDSKEDAEELILGTESHLRSLFQTNENFKEQQIQEILPNGPSDVIETLKKIANPYQYCIDVLNLIHSLIKELESIRSNITDPVLLYEGEDMETMVYRWKKLRENFYSSKSDTFNILKIQHIYSAAKYDYTHNRVLSIDLIPEIFFKCDQVSKILMTQKYGLDFAEKLRIAQKITHPMLVKIQTEISHSVDHSSDMENRTDKGNLNVDYNDIQVQSRLYFTCNSHLHSLMNLIKYGKLYEEDDPNWLKVQKALDNFTELNPMTNIMFKVYKKNQSSSELDMNRFYVEVYFSNGAFTDAIPNVDDSVVDHLIPEENEPDGPALSLISQKARKHLFINSKKRSISKMEETRLIKSRLPTVSVERLQEFLSSMINATQTTNKEAIN